MTTTESTSIQTASSTEVTVSIVVVTVIILLVILNIVMYTLVRVMTDPGFVLTQWYKRRKRSIPVLKVQEVAKSVQPVFALHRLSISTAHGHSDSDASSLPSHREEPTIDEMRILMSENEKSGLLGNSKTTCEIISENQDNELELLSLSLMDGNISKCQPTDLQQQQTEYINETTHKQDCKPEQQDNSKSGVTPLQLQPTSTKQKPNDVQKDKENVNKKTAAVRNKEKKMAPSSDPKVKNKATGNNITVINDLGSGKNDRHKNDKRDSIKNSQTDQSRIKEHKAITNISDNANENNTNTDNNTTSSSDDNKNEIPSQAGLLETNWNDDGKCETSSKKNINNLNENVETCNIKSTESETAQHSSAEALENSETGNGTLQLDNTCANELTVRSNNAISTTEQHVDSKINGSSVPEDTTDKEDEAEDKGNMNPEKTEQNETTKQTEDTENDKGEIKASTGNSKGESKQTTGSDKGNLKLQTVNEKETGNEKGALKMNTGSDKVDIKQTGSDKGSTKLNTESDKEDIIQTGSDKGATKLNTGSDQGTTKLNTGSDKVDTKQTGSDKGATKLNTGSDKEDIKQTGSDKGATKLNTGSDKGTIKQTDRNKGASKLMTGSDKGDIKQSSGTARVTRNGTKKEECEVEKNLEEYIKQTDKVAKVKVVNNKPSIPSKTQKSNETQNRVILNQDRNKLYNSSTLKSFIYQPDSDQ